MVTLRLSPLSVIVFVAAVASARTQVLRVPSDYPTLDAAVSAAADSSTIEIDPRAAFLPCEGSLFGVLVDGKNISIVSSVREKDAVFNCGGSGRALTLRNAWNVTLVGLLFTGGFSSGNGGAVSVENVGHLQVIGCSFENNTALMMGGGIFASPSPKGGSSIDIVNCTFLANAGGGGGLAVNYAQNTDLDDISLTGISCSQNYAGNSNFGGGCVYIQHAQNALHSNIYLTGCHFSNNSAQGGGGGVEVYYSGNAQNATVRVNSCSFSSNTAPTLLNGGGAVNVLYLGAANASNVYFDGSHFFGNSAPGGGGAIIIFYNSPAFNCIIRVLHSFLSSNSAPDSPSGGGGVYVWYYDVALASHFAIEGGLFQSNIANGGGGAVNIFYGSASLGCSASFLDARFLSNRANGGGSIFTYYSNADSSNFVVQRATFSQNYAASEGGAITVGYIGPSINSTIAIVEANFFSNIALLNAGSVDVGYSDSAVSNTILLGRGIMAENTVQTGSGGGLNVNFVTLTENCTVSIFDSFWFSNSAVSGGGGAVFVTFEPTSMSLGTKILLGTIRFESNVAAAGGAVFLSFNGIMQNATVVATGSVFISNVGLLPDYGGGAMLIGVDGDSTGNIVLVDACLFRNSSSEGGGGALALVFLKISTSDQLEIFNSSFVSCSSIPSGQTNLLSRLSGGAILLLLLGRFTYPIVQITDSVFDRNSARYNPGGAVQLLFGSSVVGMKLNISGCTFSSNICLSNGGGALSIGYASTVFFSQSNFHVLANNTFVNNSGSQAGGALMFQTSTGGGTGFTVVLHKCNFSGNWVINESGVGGAVLLSMPIDAAPANSCFECLCGWKNQSTSSPVWRCAPNRNCNFDLPQDDGYYCSESPFASREIRNIAIAYVANSSVTIDGCTFERNTASSAGALLIRNGAVTAKGAVDFTANSAQNCAAFALEGTASFTLDRSGTLTFKDNSALRNADIQFTNSDKIEINGNIAISRGSVRYKGDFKIVSMLQAARIAIFENDMTEISCPPGFSLSQMNVSNQATFVNQFALEVLTSTYSVTCTPCATSTYSVIGGNFSMASDAISNVYDGDLCRPCSLGGTCLGANNVLVNPGYWAVLSDVGVWYFTPCPLNYCCQSGTTTCISQNRSSCFDGCLPGVATSCAPGRDPSKPLCGACLENHSRNLMGTGCTPTSDCKNQIWFWFAAVGVCLLFLSYIVFSSSKSPRDDRPALAFLAPTLTFFVQNVSLLFASGGSNVSYVGVELVRLVFNLHFSSSPGSTLSNLCVVPSLTTDRAVIAFRLVFPLIVVACLFLFFLTALVLVRLRVLHIHDGKLRVGRFFFSQNVFFATILQTVLLLYSIVATVTTTLLHCVDVVGFKHPRLLIEGSVECFESWQIAVLIAAGIPVFSFPFAIFLIHWRLRVKHAETGTEWRHRPVILRTLEGPYREGAWVWASVTILRRLIIVLISTFAASRATVQAILFIFAFVCFTVAQCYFRPFYRVAGNVTETVSLLVLCFTSACLARSNSFLAAGIDPLKTTLSSDVRDTSFTLDALQVAAFFCPLLVATAFAIFYKRFLLGNLLSRFRAMSHRRSGLADGVDLSVVS